jgi:hypothetical protein
MHGERHQIVGQLQAFIAINSGVERYHRDDAADAHLAEAEEMHERPIWVEPHGSIADSRTAVSSQPRRLGASRRKTGVVASRHGRHRNLPPEEIIDRAAKHRLPAVYEWKGFAQSGGLIAYGAVVGDVYRRTAGYVDKILKGAKPGDLPVEPPIKTELVVNRKTAAALSLTIPLSILSHADQVIE